MCGLALAGGWKIPELPAGATYVQASAGYAHILLVRSDGCAVACGNNEEGQCNIPSLNAERSTSSGSSAAQRYVAHTGYEKYRGTRVLQVVLRECNTAADQIRVNGVSMAGDLVYSGLFPGSVSVACVLDLITSELSGPALCVRVVVYKFVFTNQQILSPTDHDRCLKDVLAQPSERKREGSSGNYV